MSSSLSSAGTGLEFSSTLSEPQLVAGTLQIHHEQRRRDHEELRGCPTSLLPSHFRAYGEFA